MSGVWFLVFGVCCLVPNCLVFGVLDLEVDVVCLMFCDWSLVFGVLCWMFIEVSNFKT